MKEFFIKKYWEEEDVLFYIHFQNDKAIKQIEVSPREKIYLSLDHPVEGNAMLYDQTIDQLDLNEKDYITKEEFYEIWILLK